MRVAYFAPILSLFLWKERGKQEALIWMNFFIWIGQYSRHWRLRKLKLFLEENVWMMKSLMNWSVDLRTTKVMLIMESLSGWWWRRPWRAHRYLCLLLAMPVWFPMCCSFSACTNLKKYSRGYQKRDTTGRKMIRLKKVLIILVIEPMLVIALGLSIKCMDILLCALRFDPLFILHWLSVVSFLLRSGAVRQRAL